MSFFFFFDYINRWIIDLGIYTSMQFRCGWSVLLGPSLARVLLKRLLAFDLRTVYTR